MNCVGFFLTFEMAIDNKFEIKNKEVVFKANIMDQETMYPIPLIKLLINLLLFLLGILATLWEYLIKDQGTMSF